MNNQECTYGFDETPILGGNNLDFTRLPQSANLIVLPFKFSWMVNKRNFLKKKLFCFFGNFREILFFILISLMIKPMMVNLTQVVLGN
jgi:hypothetical protein